LRGGSRERGFSLRTESSARFYELMSISVPDGTPEELIETSEAIGGYVAAAGGSVLRSSNESPWGRRRLAYPIRHNSADLRDGIYTLYHFEINPEGIADIEREIRLNERIIRHLLLVLDSEPIFVEEVEEVPEGEGTPATEGGETAVVASAGEAGEAAAVGEPVEVASASEPVEVIAAVEAAEVAAEEVEATAPEETVAEVVEAVTEPGETVAEPVEIVAESVSEPVVETAEVVASEEE
jgi:small subunit ribosomal protein S6